MNWREYQIKTAEFFSGIGLHTKIEYEVVGVRGKHEIDVYAVGEFSGIEFKWVIECKAWKTNIPKEKVLALSAIVQDVGADRGFLMSEVGFQSGAIRSSQTSNITLTSIEDLSAITASFATNTLTGKTAWEVLKAKNRLLEIKKKSEAHEYSVERTMLFGELGII
ncbi:MAG: restriction endonuclease [Gammaproteobacteria bacterium]|nr:restriction endonuclease [Gammaproteobacteria bacterium]